MPQFNIFQPFSWSKTEIRGVKQVKRTELTVTQVKRSCGAGYKLGDKLINQGSLISAQDGKPMCLYALSALTPYLTSLGRETPESDWINHISQLQCPDPKNTVVFSIERFK
jgi:uncharacterized repeat protein (TIGR04076 family)